jgi:hypothetical protein
MRKWGVRGSFASFSREEEKLINTHENKPSEATEKELKAVWALRRWIALEGGVERQLRKN